MASVTLAQTTTVRNIQVEGKATREIHPDIIYLHITLKEYEYKAGSKVNMDELESALKKAAKKAGVKETDIVLSQVYGYNWKQPKEKQKDFMARKEFQLKLSSVAKINEFTASLDAKGIEQLRIGESTHSQVEAITDELRKEAVLNARTKAEGMLTALDEKLGRIIELSENSRMGHYPVYRSMDMAMAKMESADQFDIEHKDIKIEVVVTAKFAIED